MTNDENANQSSGELDPTAIDPTLAKIRDALRGLRYGSLNLIVQDGLIIQMDRVEKIRLKNSKKDNP